MMKEVRNGEHLFSFFWRICQNDHSWIIFRNDHRRRKNTVSKMSKSGAQSLWWGVVKFSRHRRAEAIFSRLFFIFSWSWTFFWLFQVGRLLFPPHILLLKCQVESDGDRGAQHFWVTAVTMLLLSITVKVPFFFSSTKNIFPFFKFRRIFLLKCHIDSYGDNGVQQTIWRSTDNVTARRPIRQQTDITLCNSPISDDWFHATIFFIFHQNKNNCWCSIANFLKGNFYTKYSRWKLRSQKIF